MVNANRVWSGSRDLGVGSVGRVAGMVGAVVVEKRPRYEKKTVLPEEAWVMPANLNIWPAEAPAVMGRGSSCGAGTNRRQSPSETSAATGQAGRNWRSGPRKRSPRSKWVQELDRQRKEYLASLRRRELAEAAAARRIQKLEAEEVRVRKNVLLSRQLIDERRLMSTAVKRLTRTVNEVVVNARVKGWVADGGRIVRGEEAMEKVTGKELRAAFKEFIEDATKDKSMKDPRAYRQWLWTDRETVYLAPVGRRKVGSRGGWPGNSTQGK
jgi:hypothetical protein